ncbi:uncharacterized protein [Rutidosis leptorrhynchoides]|uniref:uncharacterized protein n=1 Tax=Rutidosis leptorrhynchoides TaxID=125765 RepID=UPI003A990967
MAEKKRKKQFGFMPGRSSIEAIHIIRSLMEKYREKHKSLEMVFLDLEKAYDCVPRELIWKTLDARGIQISESKEELNRRLELWREVLERNGLRISRQKTEYLRCDFDENEDEHSDGVNISIGDQVLHPQDSFRYLGSVLHKYGRIDDDVTHRIKVGWLKWRAATGVLCDKKVPLKLKGKFFKVAIRPSMLYGSECWPMTKAQERRMEVAEMRMLRWTCGITMLDRIPNGVYRENLERRPHIAPVRRVEAITVEGDKREKRNKEKKKCEKDVKQIDGLIVLCGSHYQLKRKAEKGLKKA